MAKKTIRKKPSAATNDRTHGEASQTWEDVPRSKWDPWFVKLYQHCKKKPGAWEDHPWGEIVFKFGAPGKVFAFLGIPDKARACVKASEEDIEEWTSLPFVKIAPYIGRFGWVVIFVTNAKSLKVAIEGIDKTYDQIAGGRKRRKADN
jgi:predicted DNA-binding protein (MmcQ/YjbR family)